MCSFTFAASVIKFIRVKPCCATTKFLRYMFSPKGDYLQSKELFHNGH